ncbi:MAG: DUF3644 domain-containing protein [Candidatus Margulisiibacteriota bacterium]
MGRKAKSDLLLDKSIQAALSAIELYNKPNFSYREESFTILIVNAWELLLKAKIVNDSNQEMAALYIVDATKKKNDGTPYKKPRYKENRSGNFFTIDICGAMAKLSLPKDLTAQLETLIEIRDNAIHFYNESKLFDKKLLEVGTATLKSYVEMLGEWFDRSTSDHNLFLIPMAFDIPPHFDATALAKESSNHRKLLEYLDVQEKEYNGDENKHSISLTVDIQFSRKTTGLPVHHTKDGTGASITIDSEEKFQNKYRWSWKAKLLPELKKRYTDFKQDGAFRNIISQLKKDPNFCGERHLDWNNKTGVKQWFYCPDILKEFDKHYSKKPTS